MGRKFKVMAVIAVDDEASPEWFERCRRYDLQTIQGLHKQGQFAPLVESCMGPCEIVGMQRDE